MMGWELGEGYSNYAMVAMMIERCIVVLFPLRSKTLIRRRFTIGLLVVCVLPGWLSLVPVSAFVFGVMSDTTWSVTGTFCGWHTDRPLFPYFTWAFQLNMFTVHVALSLVLVIVLCAAISFRTRGRRKLLRDESSDVGAKENAAIVIMLILGIINLVLFIPALISYVMNYVIDTTGWSREAIGDLGNFGRFTQDAVCIAHAFNFVVYFCRIPSFRSELSGFFSCCLSK